MIILNSESGGKFIFLQLKLYCRIIDCSFLVVVFIMFRYDIVEPTDGDWGYLTNGSSWTGLIGQLQNRVCISNDYYTSIYIYISRIGPISGHMTLTIATFPSTDNPKNSPCEVNNSIFTLDNPNFFSAR